MDKPYERLRHARQRAGFKSASAAARAHGWHEATYRHHENGTRGYNYEQAVKYAEAFGGTPTWLLDFGVSNTDDWRIPLGKYYTETLGPRLSWKGEAEDAINIACKELGLFYIPEVNISSGGIDAIEDDGGFPLFHFTNPAVIGVSAERVSRGYLLYTRAPHSLARSIVSEGDLLLIDSENGEIKSMPQLWLIRASDRVFVCWAKRDESGDDVALPDAAGKSAVRLEGEIHPLGIVIWVAKTL